MASGARNGSGVECQNEDLSVPAVGVGPQKQMPEGRSRPTWVSQRVGLGAGAGLSLQAPAPLPSSSRWRLDLAHGSSSCLRLVALLVLRVHGSKERTWKPSPLGGVLPPPTPCPLQPPLPNRRGKAALFHPSMGP